MTYSYVDMHCDSLLRGIMDGRLYNHPGNMLDVSRMVLAGQGAQFFAVFFPPALSEGLTPPVSFPEDDILFEKAQGLLVDTAVAHPDALRIAYSAADIERNVKDGICSAVLTIEDARAVNGNMEKLRWFHSSGVRAMSLTWNAANCIGYPNSSDPEIMRLGLTAFGKDAISEMNHLGILIDVSHLSDGGFWDVAERSAKPFAATHSNCRHLCDHSRNLSDEMIQALASKGGVVGVNFAPELLTTDSKHESRVEDICRHIQHLFRVGGEDCVGLGTDFDGISGQFEVGQPTEMFKLFDMLQSKGLSERQLEKFAFGNVLRVMREVL